MLSQRHDRFSWPHRRSKTLRCCPQNAGRLIDEVLTWDNVLAYWVRLISSYAALQTFNVTLHTDAVPVSWVPGVLLRSC